MNIWSEDLEIDQMRDWTICRFARKNLFQLQGVILHFLDRYQGIKPDILEWSSTSWNLTNMIEEDVEMNPEQLCKPLKPGHVLFPEKQDIYTALSLCKKMGSELSVEYDQNIQDELIVLAKNSGLDLAGNEKIKCTY